MVNWFLEKRKISSLRGLSNNPRRIGKHDQEQLAESLAKYGVCQPIVINTDGTIIGGHQRVRTLKKAGEKEVQVMVPEVALTQKQHEELAIRLNRNNGEWDWDILANEFDTRDLLAWGFLDKELEIDLNEGEDEEEEPKTKLKILECPLCQGRFEEKQAKVIDDG